LCHIGAVFRSAKRVIRNKDARVLAAKFENVVWMSAFIAFPAAPQLGQTDYPRDCRFTNFGRTGENSEVMFRKYFESSSVSRRRNEDRRELSCTLNRQCASL